ncbi:MAG: hypothetical protein ACM3JJ_04320 [Hyphomicrobiales bacterium]
MIGVIDLSRRVGALLLAAAFAATYLPGLSATRASRAAAGAVPECCAGMSCCRPGHDCARHGGCGVRTGAHRAMAGASGPSAASAAAASAAPHHGVCLTAPGCSATQPLPAPHVFDPMLPVVPATATVPRVASDAARIAARDPRVSTAEPRVPPPRA